MVEENLMKGKKVREEILFELREGDFSPHLAVLLIGNDEASKSFIKLKRQACEELGFKFSLFKFRKDVDEKKVLEKIRELNEDTEIHGILPQLPFPEHINENKVFAEIRPVKDPDGLTPQNLGSVLRGAPGIVPATVEAIMELLAYYSIETEEKEVVIINNSNLIGKPLSMILTNSDATVTMCHKKTKSLKNHTENADLIITATGQPNLIDKGMIKEDAVIIDAGYAKEDGEILGDVEFDEVSEKASKITPNPGGVGPVTVAMTIRNLCKCYKMQKDEMGK